MEFPYSIKCKDCGYQLEVITDKTYEERLSVIGISCPSCGEEQNLGDLIDAEYNKEP